MTSCQKRCDVTAAIVDTRYVIVARRRPIRVLNTNALGIVAARICFCEVNVRDSAVLDDDPDNPNC